MGYTGESIADFVDRGRKGAKLAGERMAKLGGETMTEHVKRNTPIGERDPLDPDATPPGHLRDSIEEKPVVYVEGVWESGAQTFVEYGPYVEHGTGLWGPEHRKYIIKPKDPDGVLAFFARARTPEGRPLLSESARENLVRGQLVFARFVMHPGSPGQHMFAIGAEMTEAEINRIGNQGMRVMRMYVERGVT